MKNFAEFINTLKLDTLYYRKVIPAFDELDLDGLDNDALIKMKDLSSSVGPIKLGTIIGIMPAVCAARMPAYESSSTTQNSGVTCNNNSHFARPVRYAAISSLSTHLILGKKLLIFPHSPAIFLTNVLLYMEITQCKQQNYQARDKLSYRKY
jgi:hypothetical protein